MKSSVLYIKSIYETRKELKSSSFCLSSLSDPVHGNLCLTYSAYEYIKSYLLMLSSLM